MPNFGVINQQQASNKQATKHTIMATKRRIKLRISIKNQLRDYKGFGKLTNGMTREGFCTLANGHVVSEKEFAKATNHTP